MAAQKKFFLSVTKTLLTFNFSLLLYKRFTLTIKLRLKFDKNIVLCCYLPPFLEVPVFLSKILLPTLPTHFSIFSSFNC